MSSTKINNVPVKHIEGGVVVGICEEKKPAKDAEPKPKKTKSAGED